MNNAELIKALRYCADEDKVCTEQTNCGYYGKGFFCQDVLLRDAADALEAADKRIDGLQKLVDINTERCEALRKQLRESHESYEKHIEEIEDDLRNSTISNPERFKIYGYTVKDLLLFAEMCKRNDVREADLKQAAWNLKLAVRAVMNERAEIVKNTMDEIVARFTPDFGKAFEEMMPNCGAKMDGERKDGEHEL